MNEEQLQYLEQKVSKLEQEWFTIRLEDARTLIAEVRALRSKLNAVPVEAIALMHWGDSTSFGYVDACSMVGDWLVTVSEEPHP